MTRSTPCQVNHGESEEGLLLPGLDGSNPLGFLAALGLLRVLAMVDSTARLYWKDVAAQGTRPFLITKWKADQDAIVNCLTRLLNYGPQSPSSMMIRQRKRFIGGDTALDRLERCWKARKLSKSEQKEAKDEIQKAIETSRLKWISSSHPAFLVGNNTNINAADFRRHLTEHVAKASLRVRTTTDALASLGSELSDEKGVMLDTALRTMSGSGHQHFLRFASNLLAKVDQNYISKALFKAWIYDDPIRNLTLRLDPVEDSRYAHRWDNPSTDGTRDKSGSVLAANALAVMGMLMVPTIPAGMRARTVGFIGRGARGTFLRWPLWRYAIDFRTTMSLLKHAAIVSEPIGLADLTQLGVYAVYQSQRLTVGKFRNFTPAQRIA